MTTFRLFFAITTTITFTHAQTYQNYIDDIDGKTKSFDPNQQFQVHISNKSKYRADIYWEDGMYGKNMGSIDAETGQVTYNTQVGHEFYVTRHGVREGLFFINHDNNNNEEEQVRFRPTKPNQIFVIESDVKPSDDPCHDRFTICESHAKNGVCHYSPGWMIVHCCRSCDVELDARRMIDPKVRCSRENLKMTEPAWKAGDLNVLFERWAKEAEFVEYVPTVLSSPGGEFGGKDGPWVMTFDNFVMESEANELIRGGQMVGFERSTDQGSTNALGEQEKIVSKTRTSSNAWCVNECEKLPGVQSVSARIEKVTGIPQVNYESFQILEYSPDQFYRSHHDSSSTSEGQPAGPRILTFFLYLSDVEEGGETYFNKLDIAVKPKRGRALVWPSVTNEDPEFWDSRMYHEAKDVIKGKKFAANHWIHLYDYDTPNKWGCTGSFS